MLTLNSIAFLPYIFLHKIYVNFKGKSGEVEKY
jgi:hypothetical protein